MTGPPRPNYRFWRARLDCWEPGIHRNMDRYQELMEKREGTGLSMEETEELARLMAEREGKEYEGDAENPPEDVEMRRSSVPEEEIEEKTESDS
jgi:hypothetical protein